MFKKGLLLLSTYVLFCPLFVVAQHPILNPDNKADLIFKIAENIQWQEYPDSIIIGVLGSASPMHPFLSRKAKTSTIHGKKVIIKQYNSILINKVPSILYISPNYNMQIKRIRKFLFGFPILIITDNLEKYEDININLIDNQKNLSFEINQKNLISHGLILKDVLLLVSNTPEESIKKYENLSEQLKKVQEELIIQNKNIILAKKKVDSLSIINEQNKKGLVQKENEISEQKIKINKTLDSLKKILNQLKRKKEELNISKLEIVEKQKDIAAYNQSLQKRANLIKQRTEESLRQKDFILKQQNAINKDRQQSNYSYFIIVILFSIIIFLLLKNFRKNKKIQLYNIYEQENLELKRKVFTNEHELSQLQKEYKILSNKFNNQKDEYVDDLLFAQRINQILVNPLKIFNYYKSNFSIFLSKYKSPSDFFFFLKLKSTASNIENFVVVLGDTHKHGLQNSIWKLTIQQKIKEFIIEDEKISIEDILTKLNLWFKNSVHDFFSKNEINLDLSLLFFQKKSFNKYNLDYFNTNSPLVVYLKEKSKISVLLPKEIDFYHTISSPQKYTDKIKLQTGDFVYLFSDGIYSHIENNKNLQKITSLIKRICNLPIEDQRKIILNTLKKDFYQNASENDLSIIGIKI